MHEFGLGVDSRKPPAGHVETACLAAGFKPASVLVVPVSVSSPCEICNVADVSHTCDRCGRLVCDEHFDDDLGLCVECAADVGADPERTPDEDDLPDGVDTYRF